MSRTENVLAGIIATGAIVILGTAVTLYSKDPQGSTVYFETSPPAATAPEDFFQCDATHPMPCVDTKDGELYLFEAVPGKGARETRVRILSKEMRDGVMVFRITRV